MERILELDPNANIRSHEGWKQLHNQELHSIIMYSKAFEPESSVPNSPGFVIIAILSLNNPVPSIHTYLFKNHSNIV